MLYASEWGSALLEIFLVSDRRLHSREKILTLIANYRGKKLYEILLKIWCLWKVSRAQVMVRELWIQNHFWDLECGFGIVINSQEVLLRVRDRVQSLKSEGRFSSLVLTSFINMPTNTILYIHKMWREYIFMDERDIAKISSSYFLNTILLLSHPLGQFYLQLRHREVK